MVYMSAIRERYLIDDLCRKAMRANPVQARNYRIGKTAMGFFMGQVLRLSEGRVDPAQAEARLKALLADAAEPRDWAEVIAMRIHEVTTVVLPMVDGTVSVESPTLWVDLPEDSRKRAIEAISLLQLFGSLAAVE